MQDKAEQPDSGVQVEDKSPVAEKLGLLNSKSLSDLLKSGFLDEKEEAPAKEEKTESEEPEKLEETEEKPAEEELAEEEPEEEKSSLTKGVQKRINKLVAAKKQAQAELETQKAQLLNMQRELDSVKKLQGTQKSELSSAVESLDSVDAVKEEFKKSVEVIMWCEDNPDGGEITMPDGTQVELSSDEVKKMKRLAVRRKELELPERFKFLNDQQSAEAEVVKDFPWWAKPETEEYQAAQVVMQEFPELRKKRADWKHVAGLIVLGMKAYTDQKSNKTKVTQIKKAPPQPGVTKASPSVTSSTDLQKARQSFAKNNSDKAGLTDLVKAMGFV
jgi:hypothetical protein